MHTTDTSEAPLADYRQYYGLTEDPFRDDPEYAFFGGGGRRALLEQLQHLCQFSASLLAVLGKPGVGKSRVALELANSFEPDDEICLLNAEPGAEAADVLGQMARHFSLPLEETPSVGRLLAALRHFAQMADEEDRLALTIIDDAHHLDEKTLGALISLLQGQDASGRRLHIVIFAEPEMVTRLDQFNMHDVLIHDFELPPFTVEEAADYLNFRMEMAGYMGPEVFTEERVEPWWRRVEGRLPRLHQQARQWLLESVSGSPEREGGGRPPLPVVHIIVVAVLLGVLLMVFIYSGGSEDESAEAGTPASEDVVRLADDRETRAIKLPSGSPDPQAEERDGTQTTTDTTPAQEPAPEPTTPQPTVRPETQTPPESEVPPEDELVGSADSEATGEEDSKGEPEPRTDAAATEPEMPAAPLTSAMPEIPEDEQVLLSWRPTDYTLQLLGAGSLQSVQRYMANQPNSDRLLRYEGRRQGEPWFVVVTGRFSNADEAREAIDDLPRSQRDAGPWPRPLADIQSEIEQVRGLTP